MEDLVQTDVEIATAPSGHQDRVIEAMAASMCAAYCEDPNELVLRDPRGFYVSRLEIRRSEARAQYWAYLAMQSVQRQIEEDRRSDTASKLANTGA